MTPWMLSGNVAFGGMLAFWYLCPLLSIRIQIAF